MESLKRIAVVGAGAWGSALANAAHRAGREVVMIARDEPLAAQMSQSREAPEMPGLKIADAIPITADVGGLAEVEAALMVVPAQAMRSVAAGLKDALPPGLPLISCAKGIERGTGRFMHEVLAEVVPQAQAAALSGPSFATDVARGLPTAVTLAAVDDRLAVQLARALGSATFRPYHTSDVRGVEIGGAAKNVLAIAAGIVAGRELGASALSALITRAFAELFRFGEAFGARPHTLTGLSGLGDLVLTCSSPQSRNYSLGVALGRGAPDALSGSKLAEGAFTARVLVDMANDRDVDMPISGAVAAILDAKLTVDEAIEALLTRPLKAE